MLDVAAGSAVWSLALAKYDPQVQVTIIDLPEVVERVTRSFVSFRHLTGQSFESRL